MWKQLIGKKVAALRGYPGEKFGKPFVSLSFVLFDDGETYLQLREQDPYDYHDCCSSARILDVRQDAEQWKKMMDKDGFSESDEADF